MVSFGNLQDTLSELNINVPTENEDQENIIFPQWKDITQFLDEATNEFEVGQWVNLKSFTLFEAMSAIEIMHPRMDTGAVIEETEPHIEISKRLTAEETLGVMDNLISREMAWISGHSLSQTVYTCIYFHHLAVLNEYSSSAIDPKGEEEEIYGAMRIYILVTVKCCYYIWTEMMEGNTYEEEDFTTNLSGLTFDDQLSEDCILKDLDNSINGSLAIKNILNRLEIRKSYFLALIHLSLNDVSYLPQANIELENVKKLLKQVDLSHSQNVKGTFDPNINRSLTSQTPPRPIELDSNEESYKKYAELIQRLTSICTLVDYSSVVSLMNFFDTFGAEKPYADAFSRSKLNTILYHDKKVLGTEDISSLIIRNVEEILKPPSYWFSTSTKKMPPSTNLDLFSHTHEILDLFLNRISMVFLEIFKINCHNRSRQRRILCKMVGEWQILEEEAAGVDDLFHTMILNGKDVEMPYYLSSWAYHIKLSIMEKILFLGFELELYGPHEYTMIWWYIRILLDSSNFLLNRINQFSEFENSYAKIQLYLNQATSALTEGLLRISVMIEGTQQWNQRKLVYDDGITRYLQRFKPFLNLASPPLPQYESYVATIDTGDFDLDTMKVAIKDNFSIAKKLFNETLKMSNKEKNIDMCQEYFKMNITNIVRTCVANDISLNHIRQCGDKLSFVFRYHSSFPVLSNKI